MSVHTEPPQATPGVPVITDGELISTNPATGAEVGRFPVAGAEDVPGRGRPGPGGRAAGGTGSASRAGRERLLRWRTLMTQRIDGVRSTLMHAEGGKPAADAVVEVVAAIDHIAWSARNAKRVLRPAPGARHRSCWPSSRGHLEYQPFGVIGVIGPWNYPILTPIGSIAYALAAGNAVVFKPSEYTPAVGQWLVDPFAEVVPEQPVLQIVHGLGDVGARAVPLRRGQGRLHRLARHRQEGDGGLRRDADAGADRGRRQGRDDRRRRRRRGRGRRARPCGAR